ncbi:MAG: hypothetical protein WAS51_08420 [Ilumatobacteraceae bacterium]|nr:MAG: hypothetical protein IPM43_05295 [Actinomycetota bacterium]
MADHVEGSALLRQLLEGGNPRTLGNVGAVVELVHAHPDRLDELISCVLGNDDEIVTMRAADALEKVCRSDPALVQPHVPTLLGGMATIDQPSVQWHVAQMLGQVRLTARQRARAVRILRANLDHSADWIVLNCSLDTLATLARHDATLVETLLAYLRRYQHSSYKSLSSRAERLLTEFASPDRTTSRARSPAPDR